MSASPSRIVLYSVVIVVSKIINRKVIVNQTLRQLWSRPTHKEYLSGSHYVAAILLLLVVMIPTVHY